MKESFSMSKKAVAKTTAILVLAIILLSAGVVYFATLPRPPGPATITGKVTDAKTGTPVAGAIVLLDGLTYTVGSDGTYTFSVKVGTYTVSVSMPGKYETKTASVAATEEKKYTVDVTLTPVPPPKVYKMALMVGGDETDLGFSYMAIQGAYRIRDKYGWEIDISRLVSFADQARVASDYATRKYDLIFAVGGQFIQTLYFQVPKQYNDTYFAQVPGLETPLPPSNVVALHPAFQIVGHYLGGVLTGKMTKTNAVAWICGEWYPYIAMEFWAFKAGVQSVNPNVTVYARVAGTWGDASIGYQIAKALIETKKVDIIVHVADLTGRGIIAACQAYGVKVIGSVADQVLIAPNVTLTSIMMDTPLFMEMVAQSVVNGTFKQKMGGTAVDVNLGYLAPFHQFEGIVPQDVKDLLRKVEDDIKKGVIVVPRTVTPQAPPDPT